MDLKVPNARSQMEDQPNTDENQCILKKIKSATRSAHDEIERVQMLANLFNEDYDIYSYSKLLAAQYGFYLPQEARIRTLQQTEGFVSVSKPTKALLIRDDLLALGMTRREIDALPMCYSRGAKDLVSAYGVSYVFEGATLGGKVISKRLDHLLGDEISHASSFYSCYGSNCGPHWSSFQDEVTDVIGHSEPKLRHFTSAALETFESMTHWFKNYQ